MSFSKGLFLHITSVSKSNWKKNIYFIKKFKKVEHIEIWLENICLSRNDIEWIKKKLSGYDLIVHAPFMNLSIISEHEEIRNASINILKTAIDQSIGLNAKLITIHAGTYSFFSSKKKIQEIFIESFKKLAKYAQGKIPIALENLTMSKGIHISYPILLSEMSALKKFIPNINYTVDVGHAVHSNDDFITFLKGNIKSVRNIHLHNAIVDGNLHFGFNKHGDLKLDNFLQLLLMLKYTGFLGLEIIDRQDLEESWKLLTKI